MPLQSARSLRRLVPILDWLPRYDRGLLAGDLAAGIAVTAMIVPKDLGYAAIAGVPVQNGLYAAAAGAIIYALFCTSRQISTGPSSSLAAVAGGAVLVTGIAGDAAAELVAVITVVTGVLFLLLALLRMGWIAQFLSRAVVAGFLAGAAIDVAIGELPKLTGTSADGDTAWQELGSWIGGLGDIHGPRCSSVSVRSPRSSRSGSSAPRRRALWCSSWVGSLPLAYSISARTRWRWWAPSPAGCRLRRSPTST
jgi:MFS superfamily sulfate permease-like transporter